MFLTQKEILGQYIALKKTFSYFKEKAGLIRDFVNQHNSGSLTFAGCGSSYCLSKSAEISAKMRLNLPANGFAAGDLLVNYTHYESMLSNTMLVLPSRSGGTSEVLLVAQKAKEQGVPIIGICAREKSNLADIADLMLEIPWAFDNSVCQTSTVTNLYMAHLMLLGIIGNDENLCREIEEAIMAGDDYIRRNMPLLEEIGRSDFSNVVILADSELEGIASEAALAFIEIPQVSSNYYHVLDVRHGPMVLINRETLVIMVCSPEDIKYQQELIQDIQMRGAKLISLSSTNTCYGSQWNVRLPSYQNFAVLGIPFIFVPQMIALYKALDKGINPDRPAGLDPYIKLGS